MHFYTLFSLILPFESDGTYSSETWDLFFSMFIYWFIFGCAGSLLLLRLFPSCHAQASHGGALSYFRAQVPGHAGSVVVAYRLNCSSACGLFPDQESNPRLLHWQMNSLPLSH